LRKIDWRKAPSWRLRKDGKTEVQFDIEKEYEYEKVRNTMNFTCNKLSVNIEELGCTVQFSEKKDGDCNYLLLQRTYPEEDDEDDSQYIEFNDFGKSGFYKKVKLQLHQDFLSVKFGENQVNVNLNTALEDYEKLKKALRIISSETWDLTVYNENYIE
jgi:hypothetical protein